MPLAGRWQTLITANDSRFLFISGYGFFPVGGALHPGLKNKPQDGLGFQPVRGQGYPSQEFQGQAFPGKVMPGQSLGAKVPPATFGNNREAQKIETPNKKLPRHPRLPQFD